MKTLRTVLALALAALLCAPAARAAAHQEAQLLMSQGLAKLEQGENSAAISAFSKAVRAHGGVSSYFLLGWAHYQRGFNLGAVETADRDDAQSAIDAYTMALSLDPELKELPDASRLHFSMALCYEAVSSYGKALDSYKLALHAAPGKALIPMHAARLRLKMKDGAKAVSNIELALKKADRNAQALRDAVRQDPAFAPLVADASARAALGIEAVDREEMRDAVRDTAPAPVVPAQDQAVLEKISEGNIEFNFRRYEAAIAAYHEALALNRESMTLGSLQTAMVHEKIGVAHNKIGRSDDALPFLQKALEQNPMSTPARYQIAVAYALSGKNIAALNALREALAACSGAADLRRMLLRSRTDMELTGVRELSGFSAALAHHADRVALR